MEIEPVNQSYNMPSQSRSIQIQEEPEIIRETVPKRNNGLKQREYINNEPPQDLGISFIKILMNEFKRVRQINTKDPKVLLDFWKRNKMARQKEIEGMNKNLKRSLKGERPLEQIKTSNTSQRLKELQAIAQEREEDVAYTLELHANTLRDEENRKMFMIEMYRQRKIEEEMKKTQKPKKMSKETLERLYKAPPPKADRPSSAQFTRTQMLDTTEDDPSRDFIRRLLELHIQARPTERRHLDPDRLFNFWLGMPNKQENGMQDKEANVRVYIEKYFDEKYDIIQDMYVYKYGYQTFDHKLLLNFYRNEVPEYEKKRREVDYDPFALERPLEKYCAKHKIEHRGAMERREEEYKRREQEEKEKLSRIVIKKDIRPTEIEDLAKPKDRLVAGKTLLFLKKMFPKDRILQRMVLEEFKKNKLSKYPEEYDVYDSDEEINIYKRDELAEPFKSAIKESRLLKSTDFTKSMANREKEIAEPFRNYLEQKYLDTHLRIEHEKKSKMSQEQQDKQLDRFIAVNVRKFLELRKKKLEGGIPTLKEFLIRTYKIMRTYYREATDRRFPHITYGFSKRLKRNSYPLEFKRYFFLLLKAISRGTRMSHGKQLLPFWAPPSAGSKSYVFLDTNKSYNRRINDLSRETKIKKIEEDIERTTCWQQQEFFESRLNIMMNLSDAKECTFTPKVGSKMPNQYKELMEKEYGNWASQFLTTSKASFDEWVNALGNNLSRRFPIIYKYGKFKRAVRYWKEGQHKKSYREIAEAFNIDHIKKYFNPNYDPALNKSVMYSKTNLQLEDQAPKPQEDFEDIANKRFLEDVYILITFLENHEKDIKKSIREFEAMSSQDKMKFNKRNKSIMCPLGDKCPDDLRPRWPTSNIKTISKFGKKCEFAHHTFELKFEQEMQAKKELLEQSLHQFKRKLDIDPQKPPFNPGGSVFTNCIGCGEELKTKGISKGVCSTCQLKKSVNKKLQIYRQKAANKYLHITNTDSFKQNYHEKHEAQEKLNSKMGYYRKACVLYDKERYRDAFTYIAKAAEMAKNEKKDQEDQEQKRSNELRAQLGIDPTAIITLDMLYDMNNRRDTLETDRSGESQYGLTRAKLIAYAEKMGYIGQQRVDVNEFLNYQIQDMYLKIEKALKSKLKDIERLQQKIEKLEGFNPNVEEKRVAQQRMEMSESLSAKKRKERLLRKKSKFDIDLVKKDKKIEDMQKTINYIKNEIEESKPPEAWKPTRSNDVILNIDKYDEIRSEKKMMKAIKMEKPKDLSVAVKEEKEKGKSIYNREWDELLRPPNERSSPTKY